MSAFEAKYPGLCGVCDDHIRVGERCQYLDEDSRAVGVSIGHVTCRAPEVLPDPCARCFMVPAANGVCGCDE